MVGVLERKKMMAKKRKGSSSTSSRPRTRRRAAEERCDAREAESTQRLEKLPPEVWERIFDELDDDDLFPLALSCRFFRQKQKELVAQPGQHESGPESGEPRRALKTNLRRKLCEDHPASADYLRFCSKEKVIGKVSVFTYPSVEKVWKDVGQENLDEYVRHLTAYHGYLPLLQELLKPFKKLPNSIAGPYGIAGDAARGGQMETLQWLITRRGIDLNALPDKYGERVGTSVFAEACKGGHLEIMKWLRSKGCHWTAWSCFHAAEGGHLEALKWLRSKGCRCDEDACKGAAEGGHLEILKWLRSEGCPWDERACEGAAEGGHLEVLKWLRSEGCPWDGSTCEGAAGGGQLGMLKYLHENGCPWNWRTCERAAAHSHLDVLKYAHENGCPWDEVVCLSAARYGHLDLLKYAHENGCPWDGRAWLSARESTIDYLEENGCPQFFDFAELRRRNQHYHFQYSDNEYSDEYSDNE